MLSSKELLRICCRLLKSQKSHNLTQYLKFSIFRFLRINFKFLSFWLWYSMLPPWLRLLIWWCLKQLDLKSKSNLFWLNLAKLVLMLFFCLFLLFIEIRIFEIILQNIYLSRCVIFGFVAVLNFLSNLQIANF